MARLRLWLVCVVEVACRRVQQAAPQRRSLITQAAAGVLATALSQVGAEVPISDTVVNCVLQTPKVFTVPPDAAAVVTARVVGRNTNGPLATTRYEPLDGPFPIAFAITRGDLREGVPDYVWSDEDIYLKIDLVRPGRNYASQHVVAFTG